jgi:murein DD-endopeptidase MepM/ murein hydrolase activator NlpD
VPAVTAQGSGSPTPEPPSARAPLPDETTPPKAAPAAPPVADLGAGRTQASATRLAMPVQGSIIRAYQKGRNEGIDIAAPAGTPVRAAADGTVAAVTKDTAQTPIVVLRHADNLLTVYAGVDALKVAKGDRVTRGQAFAVVRNSSPAFLHFEVRRGVESLDPADFLN